MMTAGTYGGGTLGSLWGWGAGLYVDDHGRIYPQLYAGTPGGSLSAGYTPDLEGLLTGTSVSGSVGSGSVRYNAGTSGSAAGVGFGTPGVGVTYGIGPFSAISSTAPASQDELSPFARTLQSGAGTIGAITTQPVPFLNSRAREPLGDGMTGWANSAGTVSDSTANETGSYGYAGDSNVNQPRRSVFSVGAPAIPYLPPTSQNRMGGIPGMMEDAGLFDPSNADQPAPGGLLGLLDEWMRNNPGQ